MHYDLRTTDDACAFVSEFMDMSASEFNDEYIFECNDFDEFWKRNIARISSVDISSMKIMAFHITSSLEGCEEIRANGLKNLQEVLSSETELNLLLQKAGVVFNIPKKIVRSQGKTFDIDYWKFKDLLCPTGIESNLKKIAFRVYSDYCVNGFLLNDDPIDYPTHIHERPEFIGTLGELFPQVQEVERFWKSKAKSYKVDFFVSMDQIYRIESDINEFIISSDQHWHDSDDIMQKKKWMLKHAIQRAYNRSRGMRVVLLKNSVKVPPEHIMNIQEI